MVHLSLSQCLSFITVKRTVGMFLGHLFSKASLFIATKRMFHSVFFCLAATDLRPCTVHLHILYYYAFILLAYVVVQGCLMALSFRFFRVNPKVQTWWNRPQPCCSLCLLRPLSVSRPRAPLLLYCRPSCRLPLWPHFSKTPLNLCCHSPHPKVPFQITTCLLDRWNTWMYS